MEQYLPSDEIRALEAFAMAGGMSEITMIRSAAAVCFDYIKDHYDPKRILILCGKGNNGADGLRLATLLSDICEVSVYQPILGNPESNCALFRKEAAEKNISFSAVLDLKNVDLIIDAVYGIGFHLPLSDQMKVAFKAVNESGIPILSIDIPSGVESDSGRCDEDALKADVTLTFTRKKTGLMVYPGAEKSGKVILLDAGIPVPEGLHCDSGAITDLTLYPKRRDNSHKGTFGTLCIFAGSYGMAGAAYLSALAAYRTGVGMVKIVTPMENRVILQTMLPEAVIVCYDAKDPDFRTIEKSVKDCRALVAGPGIGNSESTKQILSLLVSLFESSDMILDADALNIYSKDQLPLPKNAVITPHPKEFSRLTMESIGDILSSPLTYCKEFAKNQSVITLLKGARTVIASTDGQTCINLTGNSGMATAGAGDVLSGIIGALLCLGLSPFDAASLGAYIHGKAGDIAAEKIGKPSMMASDIANSIADVLKKV